MEEGNHCILLTPPGSAALAVVRLTGRRVEAFLRAHFSRPAAPGRCVHGVLTGDDVIDDPVVVLNTDGSADINLHGGSWVIRSVLDLAERDGFVVVERTGFPLPPEAVDGETEIEREILAHLPLAVTELALTELLRQRAAWEEIENLPVTEARRMLDDRGLWWLLHPPRVAIVGAANVGKSTLANQLFGQERSITADMPGTTRDWIGETANLDGLAVMLLDTPGVRQTNDSIESTAIERAGNEVRAADLVVLVLDGSYPLDRTMLNRFDRALIVVNKCDLPPAWDWQAMNGCEVVATSGEGVNALRIRIREHFGVASDGKPARWWTERQRRWLQLLVNTNRG